MPWLNDDLGMQGPQSSVFPGLSLVQWMAMQQNPQSNPISSTSQPSYIPAFPQSVIQDNLAPDNPSKFLNFQSQPSLFPNLQFPSKPLQQTQPFDQFQQLMEQQKQQQQQQRNSANLLQQQTQKQQTVDQKQHCQVLSQNQLQNQNIQFQLQQTSRMEPASFQNSSTPQLLQFQQQQQQSRDTQLQMQLLQKVQQQQPLSQFTPHLQSPLHQQMHQKPSQFRGRAHSNLTDTDTPSCSTSVSPTSLSNRAQEDEVVPHVESLMQELQTKPDGRLKHEDQLDASSATSFSMDGGGINECFPFPPICLDSDNQIGSGVNSDGLLPDVMLSRGFGSGFTSQRELEAEISTADISSQSFGLADMEFRAGCSNAAAVNDGGILSRGVWGNQPQRMRTYTKVQKRGSVGRSIDVTRYRDYDDLRHDLARMFGIEGQLEDPQRTDWKLVYVDHENDILLVGDDPWEEFVTCVQSIKILSAAEVQRILV